jgi:hypothetical protein
MDTGKRQLIAADTHVVALKISITGITTESEKIRDESNDGTDREVERRVTRHVDNEAEAKAATTLANALRSTVAKYAQDTVIGRLTSGARLVALRDAVKECVRDIDQHNAQVTAHQVQHTFIVYPVAPVLDEGAQKELCRQVDHALGELKRYGDAFDRPSIKLWFQRNKALASLVPWAIGTCVEAAIGDVREALKRAGAIERALEKDPAKGEAEARADFAKADWSQSIDTARGLLAPDVALAAIPAAGTEAH